MAPLELLWWQTNQIVGCLVAFIIPPVISPPCIMVSLRGLVTGISIVDKEVMNIAITAPVFQHPVHGLCKLKYFQGSKDRSEKIDTWHAVVQKIEKKKALKLDGVLYVITRES